MRRGIAVVVLGAASAVLGTTTLARAQDAPAEQEQDWSSPDAQAQRRYQQGDEAYNDGRFGEALSLFREAYELSGRPQLLYNMGIAAMNAGLEEVALDSLRRYLQEIPDAPNRALVEGRITNLERQVAEAQRAQAAIQENTQTEEEERESGARARTIGWALLIPGAVVAAAGGALLVVGILDVQTVENAERGTPWTDLEGAYARAPILTGIGFGAVGLGVALVAVGLTLVLLNPSDSPTEPSARLILRPGGLSLVGAF